MHPATNTSSENNGFSIDGAQGNGLWVGHADLAGVSISNATTAGVEVLHSDKDGVIIGSAGSPDKTWTSAEKNGFGVDGAEGNGLWVGRADNSGVLVFDAGLAGVQVLHSDDDGVLVGTAGTPTDWNSSSGDNGLEIYGAADYGIYIGHADASGLLIESTVGNGIDIVSAGSSGVFVQNAEATGVYAHTTNANHEWGFSTPDKSWVGTASVNAGPLMLVVQNGDTEALQAGDVVAAAGIGQPFAASSAQIMAVKRADATTNSAVVGVVYRRFMAEEKTMESADGDEAERRTHIETHSTDGDVAPGEYLLIVVMGVAEVKVEGKQASIQPGDSLSLSGASGQAAKAQQVTVDGVSFYPPGLTFGVALATPDPNTGLVPAFVSLP